MYSKYYFLNEQKIIIKPKCVYSITVFLKIKIIYNALKKIKPKIELISYISHIHFYIYTMK